MTNATKVKLAFVGIVAVISLTILTQLFGYNENTKFVVKQTIGGDLSVIDRGGYYWNFFATTWEWNKFEDYYFSQSVEEGGVKDESIRITFNDGGQADVSCYARIELPTDEAKRIEFNKQFSGNPDNIKSACRSHLINCLKNTAPMMQSSEHQSARKTEFDQTVREQLDNGLYQMRKEAVQQVDETDESGKAITVYVTNIVKDDNGVPLIAKESPLEQYGITITQFSITGVEYDPQTRELFAAKKKSSLLAEQSKAERVQEVQQRLMVEEKGLREKAEMEAKANVEKAEAVIKAEKEKEMAEIEAQQKVAVAKEAALEAEQVALKAKIEAQQEVDVAQLKLEAAKLDAEAIRELAAAEEEKIQKAGAITEQEKILAEIAKERDIGIAEHLSNIKVPGVTIGGNGGTTGGSQGGMTTNLINLKLLEGMGLLDKTPINKIPTYNSKNNYGDTPEATPVATPQK